MSESSEEKTNRKLSKYIENNYFQFEYSIFPNLVDLMYKSAQEVATSLVLQYAPEIKRLLSKNDDYGFLIRWRRNQKIYNYPDVGDQSLDQIYMMIYSPIKLEELDSYCKANGELNCLYRKSTTYKKNRAVESIKGNSKKKYVMRIANRTDVNEIAPRKIKLYTFVNKDKLETIL